jgi:hypothetical protein
MPCKASQCSRPGPSSQTGAACRLDPGEDRRALRRRRAGGVHAVPERAERRADRPAQALQAAEVAQARLHLEQHRVGGGARCQRRLERDAGRERQRGMRHRQQGQGIAARIGLAEDDLRRERQRGGALQPRLDAERLGRGIGADDAMRFEQGDRPLARALAAARSQGRGERLEREQRKVQGDPEHGEADERKRRRGSRGRSDGAEESGEKSGKALRRG